ncbi:Wzz/FepE/Etk N-terminal domain-containing protein [Salibaculum griseiflavum]|uniref:Wzz/FepE/Etk N-terminal domain-containing protein n=1 Tax=Salibaculum griseiflavum TaxID=1914409 RepID=UPI001C38565C|nr:Wzz/FepE/Etk N-terminal domain-containing protein [Salibaculum griseiflavum]
MTDSPDAPLDDEIDLAELFSALLSNWLLIGATTALFSAAAIYYAVWVAEPTYDAGAKFAFEDGSGGISLPSELGGLAALVGVSGGTSGGPAQTLEDRIKSRDFILKIAPEAGLFEDPEVNPPVGQVGPVGALLIAAGISEPPTASDAKEQMRVIDWVNESVSVELGENGVVTVATTHVDPHRAAEITNTIVNHALATLLEDQERKSRAQIDYLSKQLLDVQADVEATTASITEYAVENDLASDQELARASAQLVLLREQRDSFRSFLAALDDLQAIAEKNDILTAPLRQQLVTDHPFIRDADFRRLLSWPSSPVNWVLPDAIQLATARDRTTQRLEEVERTINEFEEDARRNASAAAELAALEREATVQKTIYEVIVQQFETQRITDGFVASIADVYEMAVPPVQPSAPNNKLIAALGLVLGLVVGSGLGIVRSMRRGVLHTANALSDAMNGRIGADRVAKYFGGRRRPVDRRIAQFEKRPHNQLDEVAVEIAQGSPKRVLVLPTGSEQVAGAVGLYLALSEEGPRCAVVDLTGTLDLKGAAPAGEEGSLDRFDLASGPTVFKPADKTRVSPFTIEQAVAGIEHEFDRVLVICPRVGAGAPIAAALASGAQRLVSVLGAGRTTRQQTDRLKALRDRFKISQQTLILE